MAALALAAKKTTREAAGFMKMIFVRIRFCEIYIW